MSDWLTDDIVVNGIRIHYTRTGGGGPPLVLAHGWTDNARCWTRVAKVLQADHDVIMYDARGHGLSEDGPSPYTREDMARDAIALIEALHLGKPGLMGHSMGAAMAALAASFFPEALSYVILVDPPWFTPEVMEARHREHANAAQRRQSKTREKLITEFKTRFPNWHPDDLEGWLEAKEQMKMHRTAWRHGDESPWQEVARGITCPALLVTGDPERGALVTPEVAQEVVGLMARGRIAYVPGAPHNIRWACFEPFMEAIQAFLAEMRAA